MAISETELRRHARLLGSHIREKVYASQREIEALQARLAIVREDYRWAAKAVERAEGYPSARQGPYRCPECWVVREENVELKPMAGPKHDNYSCSACHAEFTIEQSAFEVRRSKPVAHLQSVNLAAPHH